MRVLVSVAEADDPAAGEGTVIDRPEDQQRAKRDNSASDDIWRALVAANAATVLRHRRLGIPLLIWRDGRLVEVSSFDVPVPTTEGATP